MLQKSQQTIGKLTPQELLLVGIALYWGEGYKSDKHPKLSLANADPALIRLFMRFIREILRIPDERIRTRIHIHPNIDVRKTVLFWANATRLPPKNFRIITQVSRASLGKRPFKSLPYGTLDVRIYSRQLYYKMIGYIQGLIQQSATKA